MRKVMLEGLKVIEMATYVAAPAAGAMLRDWGADVTKVEPLNGCPMRRFFEGMKSNIPIEGNPIFTLDNRGKKGVTINTSDEKGAEIVREMIKNADVFLTNVRPQSLESAKLDYKSLSKINPKLVYCSLTGYGLDGDDKNKPGFDIAAYWSRSGMAHLTQRKGEEPLPIRTASGDHITAISTVSGILAALYERDRTGNGKLVETSLVRTGIYSISSDMALQLKFGRVPSTKKREEQINPLFNFFKTKVKKITKKDIFVNELKKYDEIILIGSGKGVASVKTIKQIGWKRKNLSQFKKFLKYYHSQINKCNSHKF